MPSLTQWTWVWVSSGRRWRQGSLAYCSTWGHKELDMTEQLNKQQQYNFNVFKKYLVYLKLPVPFLTAPISPSVTSVQSLSCVWLFATPWTAALQSFTISQSLLKVMSIELVMPSNRLILSPPSPPALNLSQHQSFPMSRLFTSGGQRIGASASASVLPVNIQGWFPSGLTSLISLLSRDFQVSSPTLQFKSMNSLRLSLLYGPTLTSLHDYWKNHSFDYMDLCWQSDISAF